MDKTSQISGKEIFEKGSLWRGSNLTNCQKIAKKSWIKFGKLSFGDNLGLILKILALEVVQRE